LGASSDESKAVVLMSFRTRLILLVTGMLVLAVLVSTILLGLSTRRAVLGEAAATGELVARLLARSAGLAQEIPEDVERAIGDQMVAQATILAHFISAAEDAGMAPDEINDSLRAIVDQTVLDELWVTDEEGYAYLRNIESVEFTFSPDPNKQPQAHVFWPLVGGGEVVVVADAERREIDDRIFKYVGVTGVDKPRIVEVGFEADYLDELADRVGLPRSVENLLGGGDINALLVFNDALDTVAGATILGPDLNEGPTQVEVGAIQSVFDDGEARSILEGSVLTVMAPMPGEGGVPVGVALVRLPTDRLRDTLATQLRLALTVGIAVILAGVAASIWVARREAAPLVELTRAAEAVEDRSFRTEDLDSVAERSDELGRLAAVFQNMAQEVMTREERLDGLVAARTEELATKNLELEGLSTKLSKYLSPQVYASIFTGEQAVEIASKRKKLTIFFSDIVSFTETTDHLESEELTSLLNEYLTEMSTIALDHGATIDKYIGDAIVAFFGDPETKGAKQDAQACVLMAIEMQRRMRTLEQEWRDAGVERPFRIRVGISTGYCTVGNFGSKDRMDYTIIGNEVNLAARLESSSELGGILMAHETYSLVNDMVAAEEQEPVTVKGFAEPIRNYKVVGAYDELIAEGRLLRKQKAGIKLEVDLRRHDRAEAIETIEAFLTEMRE
jgi:class 3 adenylate cyclase